MNDSMQPRSGDMWQPEARAAGVDLRIMPSGEAATGVLTSSTTLDTCRRFTAPEFRLHVTWDLRPRLSHVAALRLNYEQSAKAVDHPTRFDNGPNVAFRSHSNCQSL